MGANNKAPEIVCTTYLVEHLVYSKCPIHVICSELLRPKKETPSLSNGEGLARATQPHHEICMSVENGVGGDDVRWKGIHGVLLRETWNCKLYIDGISGFCFFLTHPPKRRSRIYSKATMFEGGSQTSSRRVPATWELGRKVNSRASPQAP